MNFFIFYFLFHLFISSFFFFFFFFFLFPMKMRIKHSLLFFILIFVFFLTNDFLSNQRAAKDCVEGRCRQPKAATLQSNRALSFKVY